MSLEACYGACNTVARTHYENFPVASLLLPAAMRPHVAALYAFARTADDLADEGSLPAEERRGRLVAWQRRLHRAVAAGPGDSGQTARDHEDRVIAATAHTIRSLDLPIALFDDLISAFSQDTMTTRYGTWADVFDYCRRSANPIGRLVLRIAGYRDGRLDESSDSLCTALQLTNFWQDFGRDWRAGRLYVPRDVQEAVGADEADLAGTDLGSAWTGALARCVAITAEQFARGRRVCDAVNGRLRYELRCTWLGGRRILDKVEAARSRLLDDRPALAAGDVPAIFWQLLRWNPRS